MNAATGALTNGATEVGKFEGDNMGRIAGALAVVFSVVATGLAALLVLTMAQVRSERYYEQAVAEMLHEQALAETRLEQALAETRFERTLTETLNELESTARDMQTLVVIPASHTFITPSTQTSLTLGNSSSISLATSTSDTYELVVPVWYLGALDERVSRIERRLDSLGVTPAPTVTMSSEVTASYTITSTEVPTQPQVPAADGATGRAASDHSSSSLSDTLLAHQVATLQERYSADLGIVREDFGRLYDLMKWFLGLMVTVVLAVVTLAVSNFWKKT